MVWHTVPKAVQLLFPKRIWTADGLENQVYLTFDDGPVPGVTDFVLNELAKRGQQATFFLVGDNLRKNRALGREIIASGHHIGNHTFNHLNGWKTSDQDYLKNIQAFDQEFEASLGLKTDLFRPPYGLIRNSQAKALLKTKKLIMWNVLSGDYDQRIPGKQILSKSIDHTRSGSIVVFHDQEKTVEVLPKVLPPYLDFLLERGFITGLL
ncbi:polysaccharide deacetylase family protein [Algoriphagus litoralis]|uniref:polysaccharide deacetylase family protein n=1 Tax=Algoriphagus litoralis TaxID=2202829 RepID=UPI000DB9EA15|nr:polysaccharide deacetylase family protein [Algoriphagus litoralis]